jgi:hypothetical protein
MDSWLILNPGLAILRIPVDLRAHRVPVLPLLLRKDARKSPPDFLAFSGSNRVDRIRFLGCRNHEAGTGQNSLIVGPSDCLIYWRRVTEVISINHRLSRSYGVHNGKFGKTDYQHPKAIAVLASLVIIE